MRNISEKYTQKKKEFKGEEADETTKSAREMVY